MATLDMHLVGTRVRTAREARGVSQTALAAQTGLNLGNLNELEQARKQGVRAETIVALAEVLQVSADYLLGLADDPAPRRRTRAAPLPPRQLRTRTRRQSAVPTRPRTPAPVG